MSDCRVQIVGCLPPICEEKGQGMGGNESFIRRIRSRGWKGTEHLSYAVGEKSIDFRKILYRLFWKTL